MKLKMVILVAAVILVSPFTGLCQLNQGLIAYYPLDGNANDASGNGNQGTPNGGYSWVIGISGQAVSLDGVNGYVSVNEAVDLQPPEFSVSVWINHRADIGDFWQHAVSTTVGLSHGQYVGYCIQWLRNLSEGDKRVAFSTGDSLSWDFIYTPQLSENQWHHLVGTYRTGEKRLYVDGVLVGTSAPNFVHSGVPLSIGRDYYDGRFFAGEIDDVRIYNRALSATEVAELYSTPIGAPSVPTITNINVGPAGGGNLAMSIQGSGFGSANGVLNALTNLIVRDIDHATGATNWTAGRAGDWDSINITSWTDSEIDIAKFNFTTGDHFNLGDQVMVQAQNPQTQSGFATSTVTLNQAFLVLEIQPPSNYPLVISDNEMAALFTSLTSRLQQQNLFQPSSGGMVAGVVPSGAAFDIAFMGFLLDLPGQLQEAAGDDLSEFGAWGVAADGISLGEQVGQAWPSGTQVYPTGDLILSVLYIAQAVYEAEYLAHSCYRSPPAASGQHETVDFFVCEPNELKIVIPLSSTPHTSIDLQCALGNWNWGVGDIRCGDAIDTERLEGTPCGPGLNVLEYSYNSPGIFSSTYGHPVFSASVLGFFGNILTNNVSVPTGPPPFTITTSNSPPSGGTSSGSIGAYNNSTLTVSAMPNSCYSFSSWSENGFVVSFLPNYTFTATGSRTLAANFTTNFYTITISNSPLGGGTATGGGTAACGTSDTVTANANFGYTFANWTTVAGAFVYSLSNYTFTVSSDSNLVANFAPLGSSVIATVASPPSAGSTTGGGLYTNGQSETLTATVSNSCYTFVNWTTNGTPAGASTNCTFTVATNQVFVANFAPIPYNIALSSSPPGSGTTGGGGSAGCGTNLTIYATPNSCYTFVKWTENGNVVSWFLYYTFTVGGARNLVANFTPTLYSISTSSSPSGGGTTSGSGIVNCGTNATVTAVPKSGYTFLNWLENGNVVSTSPAYSFTATGNRILAANFVPNIPLLGFSTPLWSTSGFGLMLQGPLGSNYGIEGSTDLLNWLPFTNFTSTNSPVYFSDPAATGFNQRFYRALMQ